MHLGIVAHQRERNVGGHWPQYLAAITSEACRRGWKVSICSTTDLCAFLSGYLDDSDVRSLDLLPTDSLLRPKRLGRSLPLFPQIWTWTTTMLAVRRHKNLLSCDRLFLIDGDPLVPSIGLLGLPSICPPCITVFFHDPLTDKANKDFSFRRFKAVALSMLFVNFLRNPLLVNAITTNPTIARKAHGLAPCLSSKISYVPEIGPLWTKPFNKQDARVTLNLEPSANVILCYGSLDAHFKGLTELVAAIDVLDMSNIIILLVGTPKQNLFHLLESEVGQRLLTRGVVRTRFGYASADLERQAFSAADVVWVGYKHSDAPSGVLQIAQRAGVPVIGCDTGVIASLVRQYSLGEVADIADIQAVTQALKNMFTKALSRQNTTKPYVYDLDSSHDRFAHEVCDLIAVKRLFLGRSVSFE